MDLKRKIGLIFASVAAIVVGAGMHFYVDLPCQLTCRYQYYSNRASFIELGKQFSSDPQLIALYRHANNAIETVHKGDPATRNLNRTVHESGPYFDLMNTMQWERATHRNEVVTVGGKGDSSTGEHIWIAFVNASDNVVPPPCSKRYTNPDLSHCVIPLDDGWYIEYRWVNWIE